MDLYQGNEKELERLKEGRNLSQRFQMENVGQEADQDDVPHLHEPAEDLADEADRVELIPDPDDRRIEKFGGHDRLVVIGDVLIESYVTTDLNHRQHRCNCCSEHRDVSRYYPLDSYSVGQFLRKQR